MKFSFLKFKKVKVFSQQGFTLAEVLVSIAIMILILALILVNYRKFDSSVVLTNLAYDVGLSVREAQTYGISVKGFTANNIQDFSYPYGIHFDSSFPKNYVIFADRNVNNDGSFGNGIYDCSNPNDAANCEKVQGYTLQGVYRIKQICIIPGSEPTSCDDQNNNHVVVSKVDITFLRPNPDAKVVVTDSSNISTVTTDTVEVDLIANSDLTSVKSVIIRPTGQISIQ